MEPNRIWHDPVVEIYGNLITPGVRCSGNACDLANRRWYQLDVDSVVTDDDWMSEIVSKHIREYHAAYQAPPSWNTIRTTSSGTPVSFKTNPYDHVARPIRKRFHYGGSPEDRFLTIPFDQVRQKKYLSRAADYCTWDSRECVFKRIEFDPDVPSFEREIRSRETLMTHIQGSVDVHAELLERFHVVPILAVVTDASEPQEAGNVIGFIMPFFGDTLEILAQRAPESTVQVTEMQIYDLMESVRELDRCGITHGDIVDWNVVLEQGPYYDASKRDLRVLLIDMGSVAPEYKGDFPALGTLILWCLERSPALRDDPAIRKRLEVAVEALKNGEINIALESISSAQ